MVLVVATVILVTLAVAIAVAATAVAAAVSAQEAVSLIDNCTNLSDGEDTNTAQHGRTSLSLIVQICNTCLSVTSVM